MLLFFETIVANQAGNRVTTYLTGQGSGKFKLPNGSNIVYFLFFELRISVIRNCFEFRASNLDILSAKKAPGPFSAA